MESRRFGSGPDGLARANTGTSIAAKATNSFVDMSSRNTDSIMSST